jgi:hypothetical protein
MYTMFCPQSSQALPSIKTRTASDHILPDTSFTSDPGADAVVQLFPAAATGMEQCCLLQIRENTAVGMGVISGVKAAGE